MAIGDEHVLTEQIYQQLIGSQTATIEVLSRRILSKDQRIIELEAINKVLTEKLDRYESAQEDIIPGSIQYVEQPKKEKK